MYHFQRDTKNQYQSTILHRCNLEFAVDQRSLLASNRLAAPCILAKETAKFFFFFFQATTDTRYFVAQPSDNNVTVSTVFSLPPLLSSSSSSLPPFSFLSFSPPSPLSPPHPPSIDYRYPIGGFHEA